GRLLKESQQWAPFDDRVAEVSLRIEALIPEVEDIAGTCRDLSERFEADPERLEEIARRLQLIRKLETKSRKTADELVAYRQTLDEQESALQKQEDDLSGIEAEIGGHFAACKEAVAVLTKARAKVAKKLAGETQKQLANLGMANARLDALLEPVEIGNDAVT